MLRPVPIIDSVLIGCAVLSAGALLVVWGDWAATAHWYVLAIAVAVAAFSCWAGRRRVKENVDGVFLAPVYRVSALLVIVAALAAWWMVPRHAPASLTEQAENLPTPDTEPVCQRPLELYTKFLDTIEEQDELTTADEATMDQLRAALGTCSGPDVEAADARRERLVERFRKPLADANPEPEDELLAGTLMMKNTHQQRLDYKIIKEDNHVNINIFPLNPPTDKEKNSSFELERTIVYKDSLFVRILKFLLAPIISLFDLDVTIEEVSRAVVRASETDTGDPIRELFETKGVDSDAQEHLIDGLLSFVPVARQRHPNWMRGIESYVRTNLELSLCYGVLSEANVKHKGTQLNLPPVTELVKKLYDSPSDERKRIDEKVQGCIDARDEPERRPARRLYARLKEDY